MRPSQGVRCALLRPLHAVAADSVPVAGHSPSTARHIVIFAASLLHPVFFVIMGCRKNFPSMLVAYVVSAFARSLLNGVCILRIVSSSHVQVLSSRIVNCLNIIVFGPPYKSCLGTSTSLRHPRRVSATCTVFGVGQFVVTIVRQLTLPQLSVPCVRH